MPVSMTKTGDWEKLSQIFSRLKSSGIKLAFRAKANDLGELVVERIQGHIQSQDLSWTPLSEKTIELKMGDDRVYIETGMLMNSFGAKIETKGSDTILYVGVDPDAQTSDGTKLSDVLIYMEYGTDSQVPRPLIQPTFNEVAPIIKKEVADTLKKVMRGEYVG